MANDSKKNKTSQEEKDLPGYPHYPSDEDITNPSTGMKKAHADAEHLANSRQLSSQAAREDEKHRTDAQDDTEEDDEIRIVPGTEADVTEEDLVLLGDRDADQDMSDDELVQGRARVDFVESEDDLDVPGAELDDESEEVGEGDEENNYYSLGGDRHENLDEDPAGGNQDQ